MKYLEIDRITKTYRGAKAPCVRDLSLSVKKGEIVALLGASGCGKTTLLKIVAGLESYEQGNVMIDGESMAGISAEKRPTAMVFQKALLFGNMTVEQNVNFSPRVNRSLSKEMLEEKTRKMLSLVHMEDMGRRRVKELSGGQEQRVSLARALITEPKVLLLDEPLSALDANLKLAMQSMICELNRELGTTMLYVTHDQAEASAVADKIALMHEGRIIQFDTPEMFYRQPADLYTAKFFGWQNYIPAQKHGNRVICPLGDFEVHGAGAADGDVTLCVRPEAIQNIGHGRIKGRILTAAPYAMDVKYTIECGEIRLSMLARNNVLLSKGQNIAFDIDEQMLWIV